MKKEQKEFITIEELKGNMCRWPIGDPKEPGFRFCGCRAIEGSPYCAQHAAMAVRAYDRFETKKAA